MARIYSFGFIEFDKMLEQLAYIPDSTKKDMVKAAAEVYKKVTQKTATQRLATGENFKTGKRLGRYTTGHTANSVKVRRQGTKAYVTWDHKVRHAKGVTDADVAFFNEYGVPGRGIPARPFIAQAVQEGLVDAYDAALTELDKFIDKL